MHRFSTVLSSLLLGLALAGCGSTPSSSSAPRGFEATEADATAFRQSAAEKALQSEVNRIINDRFAPPGVVVDADLQIVQFRGQTGPFLEPAPGEASLNLLKMAKEGLLYGLRSALHAARALHAFRAAGYQPCLAVSESAWLPPGEIGYYLPRTSALRKAEQAIHELVGDLVYRWYARG